MKANYHTHTKRCNHASGSDEMYVKTAIKAGFDILGFSDHTPWAHQAQGYNGIRMSVNEYEGYVQSVNGLKEKYKNEIKILLGLECEYYKENMPWLRDLVQGTPLDYIILGAHYFNNDDTGYTGILSRENKYMFAYIDMCIEAMGTGLYAYVAHPDLFMKLRENWDEDCEAVTNSLCQAANTYGVLLEYNINADKARNGEDAIGFPRKEFWACAAKHNTKVIIGVDAHQPELLSDDNAWQKAVNFFDDLGITPVKNLNI